MGSLWLWLDKEMLFKGLGRIHSGFYWVRKHLLNFATSCVSTVTQTNMVCVTVETQLVAKFSKWNFEYLGI